MDWEGGVAQPGARPGMDRHHGPGNTARARAVWLPGRRRPVLGRADDRGCQRPLPGHGHDALPRGMQLIVDLAAVLPTFLDAARATQRRLVEGGYPAPRPLAEWSPLGSGWAWVDSWLEAPAPRAAADAIEPLAAHLADLLARCDTAPPDPALARSWQTFDRPVGIWRNPLRPDADLGVFVPDADWITEIAEHGRDLAEQAPGPRIV